MLHREIDWAVTSKTDKQDCACLHSPAPSLTVNPWNASTFRWRRPWRWSGGAGGCRFAGSTSSPHLQSPSKTAGSLMGRHWWGQLPWPVPLQGNMWSNLNVIKWSGQSIRGLLVQETSATYSMKRLLIPSGFTYSQQGISWVITSWDGIYGDSLNHQTTGYFKVLTATSQAL